MRTDICPICGLDETEETKPVEQNASDITCQRCGNFMISRLERSNLENIRAQGASPESQYYNDWLLLRFLSAYTHQASKRGEPAKLYSGNWRDFARQHSTTPTQQKKDKLLALIGDKVTHIGDSTRFDCNLKYPLIDAASAEECYQLLTNLQDRGYVKIRQYLRFTYEVTILTEGWEYLEEMSRQVVAIGRTDYEAVPEAARQDLMKASDRYRRGDLSGALTAACAAVDSACAWVFEVKGLGDPAKVPSFQQKVIKSLRANDSFKQLETELVNIGWDSGDARQLKENLEVSLNRAAQVMQTLRSKMGDAHGSKAVLEAVVFDSLKWATIIASQLR